MTLTQPQSFDVTALHRLAQEVGDNSFPHVFTAKYRVLLGERLARIGRTLQSSDLAGALDAILSLKVSSTVVGTRELAALALAIETDLRGHDLAAARLSATELAPVAARASQALDAYLGG